MNFSAESGIKKNFVGMLFSSVEEADFIPASPVAMDLSSYFKNA